jgi:hypothetical protein
VPPPEGALTRKKIKPAAVILAALIVVVGIAATTVLLYNGQQAPGGAQDPGSQDPGSQAAGTQDPGSQNANGLPGTIDGVDVVWYTDGLINLPVPKGMSRDAAGESGSTRLSMEGKGFGGGNSLFVYCSEPLLDIGVEYLAFHDRYVALDLGGGASLEAIKEGNLKISGTAVRYEILGTSTGSSYATVSLAAFDYKTTRYIVNVVYSGSNKQPVDFLQAMIEAIQLVDGGRSGDFKPLD